MPLGEDAFNASRVQWVEDLHLDYSKNGNELQYRYITPRIIIEEDIISGHKTNTDVTYWWLSNGHPVFVSQQCRQPTGLQQGFQMDRVFLGTDYRRLPIVFNRGTCEQLPPKSISWETQLEIMQQLGKSFPGEVVRVDVYGGGKEVWFSELTFTTGGCWKRFKPAITDGLLYGLMKGRIRPNDATPENIEDMLTDQSWTLVSLDFPSLSGSYPSPVDVCLIVEEHQQQGKRKKEMLFHSCIAKLKTLQNSSLRCLITNNNGTLMQPLGVSNEHLKSLSNLEVCQKIYKKALASRGH